MLSVDGKIDLLVADRATRILAEAFDFRAFAASDADLGRIDLAFDHILGKGVVRKRHTAEADHGGSLFTERACRNVGRKFAQIAVARTDQRDLGEAV